MAPARWIEGKDFAALLLGLVVAGVIAEAACRLTGVGSPCFALWLSEPASVAGTNVHIYQPTSTLVYEYPDNPRGYFDGHNRVIGHINAQGFRGRSVPLAKRAGVERIAILGDSFAHGIGVRDEDTFPSKLEEDLVALGMSVEVMNFGVSGTNTADQVSLLKHWVMPFQPDTVLITMFLNDTDREGTTEFLSRPHFLSSIRRYSYFLNALVGTIESRYLHQQLIRHYREGFDDASAGWQKIQAALLEARSLSQAHQFRLVVALYPVLFQLDDSYPFFEVTERVRKFCRDNQLAFLDLFETFRGQADRAMWVHRCDQHPNELAHGRVARYLADHWASARESPAL